MFHIRCPRFLSLLISFTLLVAPLPLVAMAEEIGSAIAQTETNYSDDSQTSYVYLGKDRSNIIEVITNISKLDDQKNSLLIELQKHFEQGFLFAEHNTVLEVIDYAETILQENYTKIDIQTAEKFASDLDIIIKTVMSGALTVKADFFELGDDFSNAPHSPITRAHLQTWVINKNIDVLGKSTFHKHVHTKQGIHAHGKLKIGKRAKFKDNVKIEGTLSANDAVIQNLILPGGLSFTDLSVVDQSISGTLSVNDIVANGNLQITSLTPAGVVHNNASGNLSSSLIVNNDIAAGAGITDTKLATISTAGKVANSATTATSTNTPNTIVLRDGSGNFATNMITIDGAVMNPTDVATKAYVDASSSSGLVAKSPAVVVSLTNQALSGLPTIDGVSLVPNDRVLLVAQINPVENGLWLAQAGAWTRPADFASGTAAQEAYVLILLGINGGSSWLCNTPTAIIDTDPIVFVLFGLADSTTGANVGAGTGLIFRDKTSNFINFKSLIQGSHVTITNNTSDITLSTDATSSSTPNTIVSRDASGNFSANEISINDEIIKNYIRFQDAAGPEYIGLKAPTTVPTSYTLSLPSTAPTANQVLRANGITPTDLEWATASGFVTPASSKTVYVAKYGNDTTGDGSFNAPFASLAKAITIANGLATTLNPITIVMGTGLYVENNSGGPLTITANGVSIVGQTPNSVLITPNTPTNNLLLINNPIQMRDLTFQSSAPLATGITMFSNNLSVLENIYVYNFLVGINGVGGLPNSAYGFNNCLFIGNGTGLLINNANAECNDCTFFGTPSLSGPAANTGVVATGSASNVVIDGGVVGVCTTGLHVTNNAMSTISGVSFRINTFDVLQDSASRMTLCACTFALTTGPSDIDIQVSGAGTTADIVGCDFNGNDVTNVAGGTGLKIDTDAFVNISGGSARNFTTAILLGNSSDTSSTVLEASAFVIRDCATDIMQQGSSTLNFNASTATSSKIIINDPSNINVNFFDLDSNGALTIGSTTDMDTVLIKAATDPILTPEITYKSSLYSTQAIGVENLQNNPSSLFMLSLNNASLTGVTTDRTKIAGVRLVSDEGSPVGGTSALRGWDINKNGSTAELSFNYQNSDSSGQSIVPEYTIMQLDGFNNQVQLPTAATQLIFAGDTNLYRSSANVLKTDDNLIVGTLTPNRVVTTDPITNQLLSSAVTNTELGYVSGVTSPIQTQLNNKVSRSGDSMTGALNMLTQNEVRFQDAAGGEYVGINAQTTITSSYTLSLPTTPPTVSQTLRAGGITATNLEWVTEGGAIVPAVSKTIYVTQYGNDVTGNGSFDDPYASLNKAVTVANSIASTLNPINIAIAPGIYIEDNSAGPITLTADGVSIVGQVSSGVIIVPNTPTNDLLLVNIPTHISDISFQSFAPLATGITLAAGNLTTLTNVDVINFLIGVHCVGGPQNSYNFMNCFLSDNGTAVLVDNAYVSINTTTIFGTVIPSGPSVNNAITVTGSGANLVINGGLIGLCEVGITISNNAIAAVTGGAFRLNVFDVEQNGGSHSTFSGCTFELTKESFDVDLYLSDPGTTAEIIGCEFSGSGMLGTPQGTAILATNGASANLSGGSMHNYITGIAIGTPTDSSSTNLFASSFVIKDCITDILQQGSATLNFNASTATTSKITINDATNVNLAFFDLDSNSALTIGSTADMNATLIKAAIASNLDPEINYKSSLYSTQAIGVENLQNNPSALFMLSLNNASLTGVTTDRTKIAGVRLVSDEGSPVGGTSALRGWDINKNGSTAELSFNYQNSDSSGQSIVPEYTVMQLDGFNNQVQLPTAATQLIFAGDTNLYRSSANVLKTDDNLIVGTLTPGRAVATDGTTNQLISSTTTTTELGYVSGATSPIQTQLNNKVSRSGDSMTGALTMLTQNEIRLQDAISGYVGINAPLSVPSSYTVSLPSTVPTSHQVMRANGTTPTQLEWFTPGGSVLPTNSRTINVSKFGNDTTGDGSFASPYATLSKAINVANTLATGSNPICILIAPGTYIEDNSTGPLTITATGISIVGDSTTGVMIMPSTPANDLLQANTTVRIADLTLQSSSPLATGLVLTAGNLSTFNSVRFVNFQTGVACSGGTVQLYGFSSCLFISNVIGLDVNDSRIQAVGCSFFGTPSVILPAVNTGVRTTGSGASVVIDGGAVGKCATGFDIGNNSVATISAVAFKLNAFDIIQTGASHMVLNGSSFELTNNSADVDIQISGVGTIAEIVGCQFNGNNSLGVPEGRSILVSDNAYLDISSGSMKNYDTALQIGVSTDTASTVASISGFSINNCTTDILQEGSATLNFNAGTASSSKISINDSTNVALAYFDLDNNNILTVGSLTDIDTGLIATSLNTSNTDPRISYLSSLYSTQAIGMLNPSVNPSSLYVTSNNNAYVTGITTDRASISGIRLVSDEGSPIGGSSALRGWDISKNASNAELSFNYQNSDSSGQSIIPEYTIMQLDGFNNQVQLPTAATQLIFAGDTNLYRSSANVLKTDDNLIVGTLTPNRVVTTDPITNQLLSSAVTNTELGYVSGVTSAIQTQLNNKVSRSGDSMTGTLNMLAQNEIRFQDAAGGQYVGINAQATIPTSYTVSLPTTTPNPRQVLRANFSTPTNLEWADEGGSVVPAISQTVYVTKYGNDTTGDGSFDNPYGTLAKAIEVANSLSSSSYPIAIFMGPGNYVEDNSAGPLNVTADGITITGNSSNTTFIIPNTLSNDLLLVNNTINMSNISFLASGISTARGISLTAGNFSNFNNIQILNFQVGILCAGGANAIYAFDNCLFFGNGTGITINDCAIQCNNCLTFGSLTVPLNTGVSVVGSNGYYTASGGSFVLCDTAIDIGSNTISATLNAVVFKYNTTSILQTGASKSIISGCNFEVTNSPTDINIQISGVGTSADIIGCELNGASAINISQATAILISDNAQTNISSSIIKNYETAIQVGTSSDTASTILSASTITITNCTNDIIQEGSSSLNVNSSSASANKISINDSTNVNLAVFDTDDNNTLTIGSLSDIDTSLVQAAIDNIIHPEIQYKASLYATQAIGLNNQLSNPSSLFVQSLDNANVTSITADRTKTAGLQLISDTGSPVGGTSALRGWDITKNGTSAQLSFMYQNSDTVGQSSIPQYTVMQLDGVNNQLQLPTAATQLIFAGDTNLYRSSANVLKTDDNLIVGTLTPGRAVATDGITNQLISSTTTTTELGYLSGVTSAIQTQLNGKVAKSGDSMTGALNMLTQNEVRFQDAAGGEYVGLNAPSTISASYTLSLPTTAPTASQTLRAGAITPTILEWITEGGTITPAVSETIYVTQYGDDITGDGSFDSPFATLSKAIDVANSLASASYPVAILIGPGNYVEDNSAGPLTITTDGIAILGDTPNTTTIMPNTLSNDLLLINNTITINNLTLLANGVSTATGLSVTAGNFSTFNNLYVISFDTGVSCSGILNTYTFNNCLFLANTLGITVNESAVACNGCSLIGTTSLTGPPANTGIYGTGSNTACILTGGTAALCETVILLENSASVTASAVNFTFNEFDIIQNSASQSTISSCSFTSTVTSADIKIQVNDAGTLADIIGCQFDGNDSFGVPQATCIAVTDNGRINISSNSIKNYTTGLHAGLTGDTSSTFLNATNVTIENCTEDILQEGSSSIAFSAGTAATSKIIINDPTNVTLALFDTDKNRALSFGTLSDIDTSLIHVVINNATHPRIDYKSSLYSTQAIGYINPLPNASSLFMLSQENANLTGITTDRTKTASLSLISDEGSPVGGTSALRGWDITKNGTSAQLSFTYQNSDIVGQSVILPYVVMQLDGVNNQLQLPTAGTQIIFDTDTNLYRSAANVLKTDDNFIVGTLTPDRVVTTDSITNQLTSSAVTNTELGYLSGVTSSIQTQLDSKVAKAGDTMTGALQLPAGSAAAPSLKFTGSSSNTGISAATANNLSFDIAGTEQMKINSSGITIDGFTTAGVVHNDSSGLLSTSLIVNADIAAGAAITDTKLATISTAGKVANSATTATNLNTANAIVARDSSGNFSAGTITANLSGNATTATTATNFSGSLSGDVTGTQSATVVSTVGGQTASNVAAATVLANAATSTNTASTIVRRTASGDFSAGAISITDSIISNSATITPFNTAGVVHNDSSGLLSTSLIVNADIAAGAAITDTKLATISTAGKVANSATTATNLNTANAIVARDASGNFSAGTITANLSGNATTATTATNFSGSLSGDVTGTQNATVVSTVGGQTASDVAAATVLANAATSANTASTIVRRTASGDFSAGAISITDSIISNSATITPFNTAGVVHNNASGLLSSSLIVDADITAATISNSKLATISSSNTPGYIVVRDGSGNFATNMITLAGTTTNSTDAATKAYVDSVAGTGLMVKDPAVVVSISNETLSGLPTIDGVSLIASDRVLLTGQTDPVENGLWVVAAGAWSRPTDFASASTAGQAYVLILSGTVYGGSSWLCSTPTAVVDTDPIAFALFSLPNTTTGANVGAGTGLIFRDTTGNTLNFKSLIQGSHIVITNNTNDITLATDATSSNSANTIVARDASGNFSAGTITANLSGNATTATTATNFSGSLSGDVTGTQSATVVSTVGGQTASNVAAATVLANAATSANTASTIVRRTASGDFSAGAISVTDSIISNSATITPFNTAGVVHNDSSGLLSTSLIVNADIAAGAAITDTKLATISTAGKVANSATTATNLNTANAIVARDASGNFSAGTITANLSGNATTATTATNFSGSLSGDVTGTQSATVVSTVGGQTASDVATATVLANAATSANTASTIVRRTASGDFSAGTISVTDEVISNSAIITPFNTAGVVHNDSSGLLSTSLIVNADVNPAAAITDTKLATISTAGKVANSATTATSTNTANAIVARDASGNFSAGTITASLTGAASANVLKAGDTMTGTLTMPAGTAATPSIQFTGSTNTGLSAATANNLSFDINGTEQMKINSSGVTIDGFTTTGVVHNSAAGLLSTSLIVDADVSPSAGIVDTKLATISTAGKVANSATTATSVNTPNTIVLRDASGNFNAGTIVASLTGAASANVLKAGDTMTGTLQLPAGTTALPSLVFTGSTTSGLSASAGNLSFSTNGIEQLKIASGGTISVNAFTTAGVVHNDSSGNLSSSLITNADVSPSAAIADTKLATISTAGKVANSATTATSTNTANAIVSRDASGNFSAGTITANLIGNVTGNVTGSASLNVLKAGDTMTGTLIHPAGTAATPSIQFTGSTNTGLSAATANVLSFDVSGVEQMNISSSGVTIDGFTTTGVVHNDSSGLLSSSLIVNGDITNATISNAKLATISSANTAGNIVVRDGSGNFSAGTITANLIGNVTGSSSLNVLKAGDTMTGTLQLPAGTTALPSLVFTGSTTAGLSANTGSLSLSTNALERMRISSGGTVSINAFTNTGVVHNDSSGNLSSSLIVNADIDAAAAIADTKLATISTAGKVANSATTATSTNTANAIVARDASGNFSAGTITASLTGAASANVLKAGDTMTGTLIHPAGSAAVPSIQFTGSTNTGLSAPTPDVLSFDVSGTEQMNISSSGVTIDGFTTTGVVHNSSAGLLSTSLIVNADVDPAAAIVDTKLATISTAGKVANSATTATSANTANTIVLRDASNNFSAGTITASLNGVASGNVLKAGDTMTGTLQLPAGTTALPSLVFTGSTTSGLSANAGALSLSTNALERMKISSGGTISVNAFTSAGVVHNDSSGNLSSSLITNNDIIAGAGIVDTKLATISTAGKVANSATTATSANTASTIVARDASGNFSAGTITANLTGNVTGNVTGSASLNVLKAGDTMTGALQIPAGTAAAPSLRFTGSTTTGLSAATANTLSFDTNGAERMNINSTGGVTINGLSTLGIVHNSAAGLLSTSLIVNADVDPSAGIVDTKLATISTAGKVANSATTATSTNTANTIVLRDASNNFSAGTITASLTGVASGNVLKAGDTMTGTLQLPAGTTALPSLVFTGSTTSGLSANAGALSFSTNGVEQLKISSGGTISIDAFTSAGVVHNDSSGNLSSSLITNTDVSASAGIVDTKLATISTAGKVANSATTATNANTANAIVARDSSGNFSAGTITADLIGNVTGNVTGSSSLNVLKAGDTMTGALQLPAGTAAAPSLRFTGSTTTGLSAATANTLSFDTNGAERMNINSTGEVTINGLSTLGIVHNSAAGLLSTSLIVNADVDPSAGIVDTKLATISTAGKVANSATTATSTNTANTIVLRDASNNFSAGTITASLTGAASANVLKAGDTMTGTLQLPAGTTALPSLVFTGSTTSGLSASTGNVSFSTNGTERMKIASGGTISVNAFTTSGVVHNDSSGNLSTSLIVNADVDPAAAIVDTKLATISTAGKVANSATTATSANTANAIVARDASGNFSAGTITANLTGNVTGSASLNVLKAGDTMTGTLTHPAGSAAAPSIQFTGSTNTGISAATANTLSFDTNGVERMNINSTGVTINGLSTAGVVHNSAAGLLSTSLIVNADVDPAAGIVDTKLATISTAGKVANSATTATSANTANAIVARDASGNFSAGTITANLNGNATTATSTTNFSGSLAGEVTGTQGATVVSNAVSANTASAIVRRTVTGGFSAGAISVTDEVISSSLTITPFNTAGIVHNSAAGLLSTSLIVNADVDPAAGIVDTKLATISTAGKVANSATTATSANTVSAIVARDGSGNFAANMITLNGTTTNATDAATKAYVDAQVGGTNLNTPNTTVKRDNTGSFAAQVVSIVDTVASGNLVLSTNPSTSTAGNIMKGANRFIHNTGTSNTFVGENAGNFTTTGTGLNTAIGANALDANTTGNNNTALGYNALTNVTTGSGNIGIGSGTGVALTTGSNNIYIGSNDGAAAEVTTIRIGSQTTNTPQACYIQGINTVTLGNGSSTVVRVGNTTGQLGMQASSQRFKHDIVDMEDISTNIYQLRPVNFVYNSDETNEQQIGLIAEEVDTVLPQIVSRDRDGLPFSVNYDMLSVLLIKEIQKQQVTIQELQKDNAQFKDTIQQLVNRITSLEARA